MTFAHSSIDQLGNGVFRKVRQVLGVTAFGVNGMVLPVGTGWFEHFHDEQDELYFVHRGLAGFEVDGERFELGPGSICHVESASPRRVWNAGDVELVLLVVGGKGGYVERDGHVVSDEDLKLRQGLSKKEAS